MTLPAVLAVPTSSALRLRYALDLKTEYGDRPGNPPRAGPVEP
jgi:hypothetical protein